MPYAGSAMNHDANHVLFETHRLGRIDVKDVVDNLHFEKVIA